MFTGIVEELGRIAAIEPRDRAVRLTVEGPLVTSDAHRGDSIAVSGVCLTVVEFGGGTFTADVMEESLNRTSLGSLQVGSAVNLERAARMDARIGGHLVQGHVDGRGEVLEISPQTEWTLMRISLPEQLGRYVVEKGSITVSGISLTVVEAARESFTVSLIPETLRATTLGRVAVGDQVNLEADSIAKYVERLMTWSAGDPR